MKRAVFIQCVRFMQMLPGGSELRADGDDQIPAYFNLSREPYVARCGWRPWWATTIALMWSKLEWVTMDVGVYRPNDRRTRQVGDGVGQVMFISARAGPGQHIEHRTLTTPRQA